MARQSSRLLNKTLRGVHDGLTAASVELAHWDRIERHVGRVYVYWPFVVFLTVWDDWNVTHAPTGYHLRTMRTRGAAVDLVLRVRNAADWNFTSPKGRKAQRVKQAVKDLLPPLRPVS